MGTLTADYRDAIERLPAGAILILHEVSWDEYERLLENLVDRPNVRVSYDRGRLEVMTPLPKHEAYTRFIDAVVRVFAEKDNRTVESYGSATWKRKRLAKGVEPDACYYVANAPRIIGKETIDLEADPPPDVVLEIDITNESLSKFPIYAALAVPEIWRYDGKRMLFYERVGNEYREISESRSFMGLTPASLAEAIEQSKTDGQTAALATFRLHWMR